MASSENFVSADPVAAQAEATLHPATGGPLGIKGLAWAIFEGARNPYYNLVVIFIFGPYFAEHLAGGGEGGLALSGLIFTIAGILTALTAPFLGVVADQAGRRKPAIAVFIGIMVVCSVLLWWARPEGPLTMWPTMAVLVVAYCCYGYSEVLHNAMLPSAGRPSALPYISGLGLTMGNFLSVGIIIFFLFGLVLPGSGMPGVSATPILPLDQAQNEPDRFVGPFVAVWMALLMIPFFLFMPDGGSKGMTWRASATRLFFGEADASGARQGIGQRFATLVSYLAALFRDYPQTMRYLIARTIYADAVAALLTLGVVYSRTFLGWQIAENMLAGIIGVLFGAIGGVVGGMLDRWLGPKRALLWELSLLTVILLIQLSITQESLFFGLVENREVIDGPFFNTLSDLVYLGLTLPGSIVIVCAITSSRYMLVHIAPPQRIGEFFGLYAIAGSVTVWMGPGLVSLMTWLSGNQRIGVSGIGLMFLTGLAILWKVKASRDPGPADRPEAGVSS